jgi:hypothetical protein
VQRRKRKMEAFRERLCFLSLCVEVFGYYGFLRRIEANGNGHLMWWGGQAGKSSADAKNYVCTPIVNMLDLHRQDPEAFRTKMENASKPFLMEEGGFTTMTELLETTLALDPDIVELDRRLSDRALARVVVDVQSKTKVPAHWKPAQTEGIWAKLANDDRIARLAAEVKAQLKKGEYQAPTVPDFESEEADQEGFEPPYLPDGTPTALGPATAVSDDKKDAVETKLSPKEKTKKLTINGSSDESDSESGKKRENSDAEGSDEQEESGAEDCDEQEKRGDKK